MEHLPQIICANCSNSCTPLFSQDRDSEASYKLFSCNVCKIENYAIKCPDCPNFVVSLLKNKIAPGTIIQCQNVSCSKKFQYSTCPNITCRKLNYRLSVATMDSLIQCYYCKVKFQDAVCNLCLTENYFRGEPGNNYQAGVKTNCRGCKKQFLQFFCPGCTKPTYTNASQYNARMILECEHCHVGFNITTSPCCNRQKYYLAKDFQPGMLESCACDAKYRTYVCPICAVPKAIINFLPFEISRKADLFADQEVHSIHCDNCQVTFEQLICLKCSRCSQAIYCTPCMPGTHNGIVKCGDCRTIMGSYFDCSECKRKYWARTQMSSCWNKDSHPSKINNVSDAIPAHPSSNIQTLLNSRTQSNLQGPNSLSSNILSPNFQAERSSTSFITSNSSNIQAQPSGGHLTRTISANRNEVGGGIFSNLSNPSSNGGGTGLFNNYLSGQPSSGVTLFGNPNVSSNRGGGGGLFCNLSNASNGGGASIFGNLDNILRKQPSTDELTAKLNEIKETDDSPTESEEKRCSVCLENEKKVVFIPCGHLACCLTCTKAICKKDKKCPICKLKITTFQRIFST